MNIKMINGEAFAELIRGGAANLKRHAQEVNDLNVFPIPDGDTGDNMLMTMMGGADAAADPKPAAGSTANRIAGGMLLGARGNSGVILSQFFDGIAAGLKGTEAADMSVFGAAFQKGVKHAYSAVMEPTEGTILTVAREATDYACSKPAADVVVFLESFIEEAERSLERTPDLLPVLKKAGVIDSGGAGLIYIAKGMLMAARGETEEEAVREEVSHAAGPAKLNLDLFDEDSVLEFGYCTECMLRLQNRKCDPVSFDVNIIRDYLQTIGNSIVCFKNGSIVKLHVHTMTPDKVLAFCQQFGEFLTLKIENMSLQHNNVLEKEAAEAEAEQQTEAENAPAEHKSLAVVAVAAGFGVQQAFRDLGADEIVDGGQSMNPSSEDFLKAFDHANADTILVLPNNGNIILAARQAAIMYEGADVRVIESRSIGDGYAALSMMDPDAGDIDTIVDDMNFAMDGVVTASVSLCVRDAVMDGMELHTGDYIGFVGKTLLSCSKDRKEAAERLIDKLDFTDHEVCVMIRGKDSDEAEADALGNYITSAHRGTEIYPVNGGQDIYSYIIIVE